MSWRPEKWLEIKGKSINRSETESAVSERTVVDLFEAGADAMLEALRGAGILMGNYQPLNRTVMETAAFLNQCKDGVLIFIPDEEDEMSKT